jgi:hypothetical protein
MLFGVRHLALLLVPAIAVAFWQRREQLTRPFFISLAVTLCAICSLWAAHHDLALGSPFAFESFVSYELTHPHSFLGFDFDFQLLNYPFHEYVVRTPYNPYPNFLMMPFWVLDRLGVVAVALAILGFFSFRKGGFNPTVLALYCIPTLVLLAALENWMQPNKMGIQLMVMPPVCIAAVVGIHTLLTKKSIRLTLITAGLAALLLGSQFALAKVDFQADQRAYTLESPVRAEQTQYLDWEQEHLVQYNLLPNLARIWEYTPFEPIKKLRDLNWDLSKSKHIGPPPLPENPAANHITLRIDLTHGSPLTNAKWLKKSVNAAAGRALKPTVAGARFKVQGGVAWAEMPLFVGLRTNRSNNEIEFLFEFGHSGLLDEFSNAPFQSVDSALFDVLVPANMRLSVTEVVSDNFSRYYRWLVDPRELELPPKARIVFTN